MTDVKPAPGRDPGDPLLRRRSDGTPVLDTRVLARTTKRFHFNLLGGVDKVLKANPALRDTELFERRQAGALIPRWFEMTRRGFHAMAERLRNTKASPKAEMIARYDALFARAEAAQVAPRVEPGGRLQAERLLGYMRARGIHVVREGGKNCLWVPSGRLPREVEELIEQYRAALSAAIAACDPDQPDPRGEPVQPDPAPQPKPKPKVRPPGRARGQAKPKPDADPMAAAPPPPEPPPGSSPRIKSGGGQAQHPVPAPRHSRSQNLTW
jgi:hypothetical protein